MSDIGTAVHTYLQTKAPVTALAGDRGFPDTLPQGETGTSYTYKEIDGTSEQHLTGITGVCHARVQINCYAELKDTASALREQIRLALQDYRGPAGGMTILGVEQAGKFGRYEAPIDGNSQGRYLRSMDFLISHREAISV